MKVIKVTKNEAGQRFDKLLAKVLNQAPKSFLYKMLRKKNITLNGKKADGSEKLSVGDEVKIFLSDETYEKFATAVTIQKKEAFSTKSEIGKSIEIIYEDENLLVLNKPVGLLSQKAEVKDISINEHVLSYLVSTRQITKEQLATFSPGICNRLDRNTSGLIVAGKSLIGLQTMAEAFKMRTLHKDYHCIVKDKIEGSQRIQGYLKKDEATNKVSITAEQVEDSDYIETEYTSVKTTNEYTLLTVRLITGKTHQIRAHLKSIGHPIVGDGKYGSRATNEYFQKTYGLNHQLLHAYRLEFPEFENDLKNVSRKVLIAKEPQLFQKIVNDLF